MKTIRDLNKRPIALFFIVISMAACGSAVPSISVGDSATTTLPSGTTSTTGTISTSTSTTGTVSTSTSEVTPSTTTTPSTTSTTVAQEFGKLGDTLVLSTDWVIGPGTPKFNVTLNQLVDPADIQIEGRSAPQGERFVEMNVTILNVGSATLPMQGISLPSVLAFEWYLNPSMSIPDSGEESSQVPPSSTCQGVPQYFTQDVTPGQSITGCVQFGPIPDSDPVTGFEAALAYGGSSDNYPGVWQIS